MSRFGGYNAGIIILAFIFSFSTLVGASSMTYKWGTERPMAQFLSSKDYVRDYRLITQGREKVLDIRLDRVADLACAYHELKRGISDIMGDGRVQLVIRDSRDNHLSEVYHKMHFAIQEAIMTGDFTMMNQRLEEIASSNGIKNINVSVDSQDVFVQMAYGSKYLYEIVPRGVSDSYYATSSAPQDNPGSGQRRLGLW